MKPNLTTSTRTFQKNGKWVEKKHVTEVLVCACGYKYIKTRDPQTTCLKCMALTKNTR